MQKDVDAICAGLKDYNGLARALEQGEQCIIDTVGGHGSFTQDIDWALEQDAYYGVLDCVFEDALKKLRKR